ncbi:MAG: phosphoribosylformimino-5-aminoimidazole carboxamide ribotide isomerase [Verrucomicrobiota bacterium]
MTRFRPCIDLHEGKVKQIVGGSLEGSEGVVENFVADRGAGYFAERYREDGLDGGHVILLGPGNEVAAREALVAYPGGMQVGGGIDAGNAVTYLEAGASHVIVTSAVFDDGGVFVEEKLAELSRVTGPERLVMDLSCRRRSEGEGWVVAMDRWRTRTDLAVTVETMERLAEYCAEFLVHAADVEGKCEGIDEELVSMLGSWGKAPVTYAGGARVFEDLARVEGLSVGRVDLTIGSALDLFGGTGVRYADCVAWNGRGD